MYPNTATISLLPLDPANGYAPSFVIFGGAVRALGGCRATPVCRSPMEAVWSAWAGPSMRAYLVQRCIG